MACLLSFPSRHCARRRRRWFRWGRDGESRLPEERIYMDHLGCTPQLSMGATGPEWEQLKLIDLYTPRPINDYYPGP
jgi:hypothetical protein